MGFRTTTRADQDITDIFFHGATAYGDDQAGRYVAGLVAVFELLAENPRLARERAEFDPPVRLHVYKAHLIVYSIFNESGHRFRVRKCVQSIG